MTEQQINDAAIAIKDHLIQLAIDDKLPLDMTQLDETFIVDILTGKQPTGKDEAIEEAGHYLCDSDELTMEEQIRAIAAHAENEDGNDLVASVEGVVVWEKLQHSLRCQDFLDMIDWKDSF